MATLTRGLTLGASEQVTNTKLHNLVDLGSISNIANADISDTAAIVDTKLAQITTIAKVSGIAITNLNSMPSTAGILPSHNIFLSSLSSVSGFLRNINAVSSLASGALIRANGSGGWYASMT